MYYLGNGSKCPCLKKSLQVWLASTNAGFLTGSFISLASVCDLPHVLIVVKSSSSVIKSEEPTLPIYFPMKIQEWKICSKI